MQSIRTCTFPDCGRKHHIGGHCDAHYRQARKGQKLRPIVTPLSRNATPQERIDAHTKRNGECWEWTAYRLPSGYGLIGAGGKRMLAHRYSYESFRGGIPEGMVIDHICHNPPCVNPDHLQAVTQKQNTENRRGAQPNSSSGIRGVHRHSKVNKWVASVGHHGDVIHVGLFDSIDAAAAAVRAKRNQLFTNNLLDRDHAVLVLEALS